MTFSKKPQPHIPFPQDPISPKTSKQQVKNFKNTHFDTFSSIFKTYIQLLPSASKKNSFYSQNNPKTMINMWNSMILWHFRTKPQPHIPLPQDPISPKTSKQQVKKCKNTHFATFSSILTTHIQLHNSTSKNNSF